MIAHPPGPWRWEGHALKDANGRSILFAEEIGPRVDLSAYREDRAVLDAATAEAGAMQALIASAPAMAAELAHLRGVRDALQGLLDHAVIGSTASEFASRVAAAKAALAALGGGK